MKHWIWELLGILLIVTVLCSVSFELGVSSVDSPEPVIEYVEVPHYQIIERVVEKVVVKTVEVPVEKIVYKNYVWREFESVAQFTKWYHAQDFKPMPFQDCDDEALRLQREAFAQGYYISVAITSDGTIYGVKVTKPNHTGNLVLIDNVFYFVEPEPANFEVVKIVNRD